MNFLAHLYLTHTDEALTVGNFLADFIRNRDLILFPAQVKKGVYLHRKIDHYTDTHDIVVQSTRLIRDSQGKYAPVTIDIFYDYILSKKWSSFHNRSLKTFTSKIYATLRANSFMFPTHLEDLTLRMIDGDFLNSYGTYKGLEKTFERLDRRAKFETGFRRAVEELEKHEEQLTSGFMVFFPELIEQVEEWKNEWL